MLKFLKQWQKILQVDEAEEGQGLMEYALVLLLVAVVVVAVLIVLGPQVGRMFSAVTSGLS